MVPPVGVAKRKGRLSSVMPAFSWITKCRCGPLLNPVLPDGDPLSTAYFRTQADAKAVGLQMGINSHGAIIMQDADLVGTGKVALLLGRTVKIIFHIHDPTATGGQYGGSNGHDDIHGILVGWFAMGDIFIKPLADWKLQTKRETAGNSRLRSAIDPAAGRSSVCRKGGN